MSRISDHHASLHEARVERHEASIAGRVLMLWRELAMIAEDTDGVRQLRVLRAISKVIVEAYGPPDPSSAATVHVRHPDDPREAAAGPGGAA